MSLRQSGTSLAAKKLDPSYVALDLTYRCGFKCGFCFVKNNSLLKPGRRELRTAGFKKIIADLAGRPRRFYVTGGEPGLRKDLFEIIGAIKAAGHSCLITTNASALGPAAVKKLAAAGADELVISLHGERALHDRTAGFKGAFERAARAVRLIKGLPAPRPSVTLWCTINKANHARLTAAYRSLSALAPDHMGFNHLEYISERDFRKTELFFKKLLGAAPAFRPSEHLARGIDPFKLVREIKTIKELGGSRIKFYPDLDFTGIKAWYDPARTFKKTGFCAGQWDALWISPYGNLLTCQPLAHNISSVREGNLRLAYNSPAYTAFRRALLKRGGFFPACARCGREPYQARKKAAAC
jgi:MoaA/NifB/PqqE/SkfB family radical SAM enzyme